VWDAVSRGWRTLRFRGLARHPGAAVEVAITRYRRHRYKLPDIEVVGLWPDGVVDGAEPPMSVRVEDAGKPLRDGGRVTVLGRLAPGSHVLLVAGDTIVWPLRRVRAGLRPRSLRP
jgi:hypothetical protein